MVEHNPSIVADRAKPSVFKAIIQGVRTVEALRASSRLSSRDWTRKNNFLIVVTYKELFFGTGNVFYEGIALEKLDKELGGDPTKQVIPLEHMYFISIDEYDWLINAAYKKQVDISSIILKAARLDADSKTSCFTLSQHLSADYKELSQPDYLEEEFDAIMAEGEKRLMINPNH